MRRAFALVTVLSLPSRASADVLADDAIATGHLLADDDLLLDRGLLAAPLERGSLGVSVGLFVARWHGPDGAALRWGCELVVQIPLERLTNKEDHVSKMNKLKKRWGAAVALPSALALAGAAKGKPNKADPAAAGSASIAASTSASIVTTSAPSVAGVVAVTAAGAPKPLSPSTIRALVVAAWKTAGVDRDDAITDLASRARASALAPELRLRALRGVDAGARIYRVEDGDRATVTDGTQSVLEARLSWRLDRLVFADEEIALERIRLERAELKQRVSAKVLDLVMRFQRARRASLDPELLAPEREEAAITATECLLALDVLTGGAAGVLLVRPSP